MLWLERGWNGSLAVLGQDGDDAVGIGRQVHIHSQEDEATQSVLPYDLVTVRDLAVGI